MRRIWRAPLPAGGATPGARHGAPPRRAALRRGRVRRPGLLVGQFPRPGPASPASHGHHRHNTAPRAARVGEPAGQLPRQAGGAARREQVGHRVPVRAGPRDLRRADRSGIDLGDEGLGDQRGPDPAERGLLERRVLRQPRLRGRQLPERDQGVRPPAQRQRHGRDPGPALVRRPLPGALPVRGGQVPQADARRGAGDSVLDIGGEHVQGQRRGHLRPVQRAVPGAGRAQRGGRLAVLAARRDLPGDRLSGGRDAVAGQRGPRHRRPQRDPGSAAWPTPTTSPGGWPTSPPTPITTWPRPGTPTTSTRAPACPAGPARWPR